MLHGLSTALVLYRMKGIIDSGPAMQHLAWWYFLEIGGSEVAVSYCPGKADVRGEVTSPRFARSAVEALGN